MDKLSVCSYNELKHYTNLYSLSVFDASNKRGCLVSTSKNLYRLTAKKSGEVQLVNVKISKALGSSYLAEIEIIAHSCLYYKKYFYLAFTCKSRRDKSYCFMLKTLKYLYEDIRTNHHIQSTELKFVPYKILLVISM